MNTGGREHRRERLRRALRANLLRRKSGRLPSGPEDPATQEEPGPGAPGPTATPPARPCGTPEPG